MKAARSFLLLEVVVGLALLAGMGVGLLRLQAAALRTVRQAEQLNDVAMRVEQLLIGWSVSNERVTLPASGQFTAALHWRREARPVRVALGQLATQISVVVSAADERGVARDTYRVDWLVRLPTRDK